MRNLEAELNGELLLGRARSGKNGYLSLDYLKETSVHIMGASGYGKSYYLRHLIDQLLIHNQAFGLIDPHQELYQYALWRLRRSRVRREDIIPIDPGDTRYAVAFNPLSCGLADPGETASMVLEAFLKAWGQRSFDETPRLEGILRGLFRLLIEGRLTLLEGPDLLGVENGAFRRMLLERVSDRFVRQDWQEFERLAKTDAVQFFESSRNRLRRVLQAEPLRWMFAQTRDTLDFKTVLDQGKFLLANLGGISAPETQRLVGALLVNGIYHAAKRRDTRRPRHWFLICDEFGEFATRDFANSLDQLRKFGVHLILAHQRLSQLDREDPDVMSAVMTNAKIKIVFGGLERPEAERAAHELFTGQARGNRVKHISKQTKFRPELDTFEVEADSFTDTEGDTDSSGWSRRLPSVSSPTESESESGARSRSGGRSHSHSLSHVPITRHEEFDEETGRQFYTLQEDWERLISVVHSLPKRHALIRIYNRPVIHIVTPEVRPERRDDRHERFRTHVLQRCPNVKPVDIVKEEIQKREKAIAESIEAGETKGRPSKPKTFRV